METNRKVLLIGGAGYIGSVMSGYLLGLRQNGRLRGGNVIDVPYSRQHIKEAISRVMTSEFRKQILSLRDPYGIMGAPENIVRVLKTTRLDRKLLNKKMT